MSALLLRGARLVGRDAGRVDVLVEDGTVSAVARDLAPGAAEVVDLDGRWLGPGLWDAHVHMEQWALVRSRLDLGAATSAREVAALVGERLRTDPPADGEPLVGHGFRDGLWPDAPEAALLDAVAGPVPVVLVSADLHAAWLDTAALARYAPGHAAGADRPAGLLREGDAFAVSRAVSQVDDAVLDARVHEAAAAAASRGVVGVVDLEMTFSLDRWARRVAAGTDQLRVRCGVYPHDLEHAVARGLRTGDVVEGTRGLVEVGPAKVITDGSLGTRTAWCHDPYAGTDGGPDERGLAIHGRDELQALVARAWSAGLVPAVHAIGDAAATEVLDVLEAVGARGASMEHAQLLSPADVPRFARLGVVASVQPEHAMDDRDLADRYWAGRTDRAFVLDALAASGATLRFGSDAPVAALDPWVAMSAAVSRSRDGREPWHPEQRITPAVAWTASTGGRLAAAAGDVADLVVTEHDPLSADGDALRTMPVAATLVAGRFTHRAF